MENETYNLTKRHFGVNNNIVGIELDLGNNKLIEAYRPYHDKLIYLAISDLPKGLYKYLENQQVKLRSIFTDTFSLIDNSQSGQTPKFRLDIFTEQVQKVQSAVKKLL